uniref:beta-galactosidase-1-like protein 2 n=1 Tax=Styela clava TaxID=7725 RepID=UPI001939D78E|nr:beta-galactosidase-1-like protein 2 [Styela clava]
MQRRGNSKLIWILNKRYGLVVIVILFLIALRQMFSSEIELGKTKNDLSEHNNDYIGRISETKIKIDKKVEGRSGLTTKGRQFYLDGKRFRILGGEIHYFRFPLQYWRHRLLLLKACGLNTVTTYIPWNAHEPIEGKFDFSNMLDLAKFIEIAEELELYVILRIGPYICAEWEWGGLPSWLLRGSEIKIRTSETTFINHVRKYFDKLLPIIRPYQYTHGGPVIAVQVENEYAAFPNYDPLYVKELKDMVIQRGIEEFLFVCDDRSGVLEYYDKLDYGGMMRSINLQHKPAEVMRQLRSVQRNWPLFVSEYWTGWFNWWGGPNHDLGVPWLNSLDVSTFENNTKQLLNTGASINMYVFAGGTNFGFMNGGMIQPGDRGHGDITSADITSYDYNAPVTEEGKVTDKYYVTRKLLQNLSPDRKFINPPPEPELEEYASIKIDSYVTLNNLLEAMNNWMFKSKSPISMESFPMKVDRNEGQAYGYAFYECTLTGKYQFKLDIAGNIRDRALLFLDNVYQETITPVMDDVTIRSKSDTKHTVSFMVENQGRVNWVSRDMPGIMEKQKKGIIGDIKCNDEVLENWKIWPLEFDAQFLRKLDQLSRDGSLLWHKMNSDSNQQLTVPALLMTTLKLGKPTPKDTFLELEGFEKGLVIVNGINIGRYWNSAGPQKRLYLPGVWLHAGDNDILIFEEAKIGNSISFHKSCGMAPSQLKNKKAK